MHCLNTFGARTSHGQTRTHETHHGLDLGGSHHLPPYSILCASPRGPHPNGTLSRDSQVGVLKFPNLRLSQLWGPITFSTDLWSIWSMKQSCSPCWELSNGMWQDTCTQGNRVNSRLLVVGSQIVNLTPNLSFDHNLCFRCPNGTCEPILEIDVLKDFQWYKECFNPMSFDPCDRFLKIWESIGTPTPNVGVPLGVWGFIPSHSFALSGAWNVTLKILSWFALLQTLALVASPRLGLR
jgi:hypothetical protein